MCAVSPSSEEKKVAGILRYEEKKTMKEMFEKK